MRLHRRIAPGSDSPTRSLGILSSAFDPPTRAHLALARSALQRVEEVLFVLPGVFPHKQYDGVTFEQRLQLLELATSSDPRFSIGSSEGGLFIEIARECRDLYGPDARLCFLCGRDAAERIVGWDYGAGPGIAEQLREFELLVAPRHGVYVAPEQLAPAIRTLPVAGDLEDVSSTDVRARIRTGLPFEHLVPEATVERVRDLYGSAGG